MVEETIDKIKNKLKEIIKARKISINQLAIDSDVSDTCIRNWFSNRNYTPTLEKLLKICRGLHINAAELFIDDNNNLYPLDNSQKELINEWNSLNEKQKQAILIHIKSYK
jgi:transcriptional regulator with XRE-family HTH domain